MLDEPTKEIDKAQAIPPPPAAESAVPTPAIVQQALQSALARVPDQEVRTILSLALSQRTSFGIGPDAETMKVLAETEIHEETCRLKGFESSLANKDKQAERDHDFRKRKLNQRSFMTGIILLVTVCGVGAGLVLSATGSSTIGNPVLIASFTMLSGLAGNFLSSRDKD
jgi:hypothetical protein